MSTPQINNTVKVVADWAPDAKRFRAKVVGFHNMGRSHYIKIRWLGKNSFDLTEKFGILFPPDELEIVYD